MSWKDEAGQCGHSIQSGAWHIAGEFLAPVNPVMGEALQGYLLGLMQANNAVTATTHQ